ncbi:hypothetical protein V7S43_011068 [Phytophthora oleae]|uniref:Uncharacterized protein n=1 Tax=Phytophthora oleae TaxID=2107226 RepID=A0ABD3FA52_9STRA
MKMIKRLKDSSGNALAEGESTWRRFRSLTLVPNRVDAPVRFSAFNEKAQEMDTPEPADEGRPASATRAEFTLPLDSSSFTDVVSPRRTTGASSCTSSPAMAASIAGTAIWTAVAAATCEDSGRCLHEINDHTECDDGVAAEVGGGGPVRS